MKFLKINFLILCLFWVNNGNAQSYDFGDAPASYGTLLIDNGARHVITSPITVTLGRRANDITIDSDGFEDGVDDTQTADDDARDDGILNSIDLLTGAFAVGKENQLLRIRTFGAGTVHVWVDFNADGDFLDPLEYLLTYVVTNAGDEINDILISNPLPPDFAAQESTFSYLRIRYTSDPVFNANPSPLGEASNGEVEDYKIKLGGCVCGSFYDTYLSADCPANESLVSRLPNPNNPIPTILNDWIGFLCTVGRTTDAAVESGALRFPTLPAGNYTLSYYLGMSSQFTNYYLGRYIMTANGVQIGPTIERVPPHDWELIEVSFTHAGGDLELEFDGTANNTNTDGSAIPIFGHENVAAYAVLSGLDLINDNDGTSLMDCAVVASLPTDFMRHGKHFMNGEEKGMYFGKSNGSN